MTPQEKAEVLKLMQQGKGIKEVLEIMAKRKREQSNQFDELFGNIFKDK